jgi:hypothetical protein
MKMITPALAALRRLYLHRAAVLLGLAASAVITHAAAQTVPVALNMPATVSANVLPGAVALDVPFAVSGADSIRFDLIVPVDGAALSLIDPAGNAVYAPGDARVVFHPGRTLTPALPGGIFVGGEFANPVDGTWTLRLRFPAASATTAVLGTVFAKSRYQVGIAIERNTLLVGEDVSVGMVVLEDGRPVTGLSPSISVNGGTPGAAATAVDDGRAPDGLANDGVYSIDYTFGAAGQYDVSGSVEIPTAKGPIHRTATMQVNAVAPKLGSTGNTFDILRGVNNCISALRVTASFNVRKPGRYATLIRLSAPNGKQIDIRKSATRAVGAATVEAGFSAADLKTRLGSDGPYTVSRIEVLEVGSDQLELAYRSLNAGVFNGSLANLCAGAIELQPSLTATPVLVDAYINAIRLSFPVTVISGGFYQISFKLIGSNNQDIALLNASRALQAGPNTIELDVPADRFQNVDGPYRAISLLVVQGGTSARLDALGSTDPYARWQFTASHAGDLDGDGVVGPADGALLAQFRNQPALKPGDRRDLNRDGVIDLRDARIEQTLR